MLPYIGTAGWNLREEHFADFPCEGTHLERYAARFNAVEINSSFYRPHQTKTYLRWAASTPDHFRFAVKLPKQVTHVMRLKDARLQIEQFAAQVAGLEQKLGAVLVQLPPSLAFVPDVSKSFFEHLKAAIQVPIYCEPRHPTWFTPVAEDMLSVWQIARVAVDPATVAAAAAYPGGCRRQIYFRWHGSPRMYYSDYDTESLEKLAAEIRAVVRASRDVWCVFDNTAEGFATANALKLAKMLGPHDE